MQTVSQVVDQVLAQPEGERWTPLVNARKDEHVYYWKTLGFSRARINSVDRILRNRLALVGGLGYCDFEGKWRATLLLFSERYA
ncbi:hypothetical protein [Methylomonas sp. UP202]|uniref:hypothetical protein n=1 Tax=unclassified Methylomonas TaxID=2608980 RepID=UPI00143BF4B6|nr:hypothetical protein [Methylomonas sp. UP202]NJA08308.1 hypothetical protein [Methylococcaceae bacterium WWC4]WGS84689.1 hypothetical protein QC632_16705 [Methylomonas sp. UP202]